MTKMPTWFAISTKTEEEEAAVVEGELEPSVEDMLQLKLTTRMMAWSEITTRKVAAAAGVVVVVEKEGEEEEDEIKRQPQNTQSEG